MKLEILVPDSLSEITLGQYQKFLRVEQNNEQFVAQKMLEIFCGVKLTEAMSMRIKDVRSIISHLDELLNQQPQLVKKFSLKGQEYGFIPNLEDMSFGEYIDLDTFLGDWSNMHKAMSVLYRPIKDKYGERYNIIDYDVVDAEQLRDMPLDAVISSLLFFYRLGIDLSRLMTDFLEQEEESRIVQYLNSDKSGVGINQYINSLKETLDDLNILLN